MACTSTKHFTHNNDLSNTVKSVVTSREATTKDELEQYGRDLWNTTYRREYGCPPDKKYMTWGSLPPTSTTTAPGTLRQPPAPRPQFGTATLNAAGDTWSITTYLGNPAQVSAEAMASLDSKLKGVANKLLELCRSLDVAGRGFILKQDFAKACASLGADLNKAELEVLVPMTDPWDQINYEQLLHGLERPEHGSVDLGKSGVGLPFKQSTLPLIKRPEYTVPMAITRQ